jgi:hypothetical protein
MLETRMLRYCFFGWAGAGCELAGVVLDAGGVVCGAEDCGTGVCVAGVEAGVVAGVFFGADLEMPWSTEPL